MPLGPGLETDGQGSVQTSGSEPSEPSAMLYGSNGFVGVGTGLQIGTDGSIEQSDNYIYCVPQFSNLPVTYPPYGCETEVNTAGVTDFTEAWKSCNYLTGFPCLDTSSGTDFSYSWAYCTSLASFPPINVSSGINFDYAWAGCSGLTSIPTLNVSGGTSFYYSWGECEGLTEFPSLDVGGGENFMDAWVGCISLESFPMLDTSKGTNFYEAWRDCSNLTSFPKIDTSLGVDFNYTWEGCSSLTSFPSLDFGSGLEFGFAWANCSSLTSFPSGVFDSCPSTIYNGAWQNCALSQQSVDNILVSLNTAGQSNGVVNIDGGTSSAPGAAGLAAKASLEGKGWTVTVNGVPPTSHARSKSAFKFPENPEPFSEFTDPETGEVYEWARQRLEDGTFKADDPETVEDEAWHWVRVK